MLVPLFWAVAALLQPAAGAAQDPYAVGDPFATEAEPAALAPASPVAPAATAAATASSGQELICRSRPEINTRTRFIRTCLTADQWVLHEASMEQQRRDINDMGAAGCDRNVATDCIQASGGPRG